MWEVYSLLWNSVVAVLRKSTARVSPPDRELSELSLRKQPPFLQVTESGRILFTDGDYVIKSKKHNFPGCLVGHDLNHTTHNIHMIINSQQVRVYINR